MTPHKLLSLLGLIVATLGFGCSRESTSTSDSTTQSGRGGGESTGGAASDQDNSKAPGPPMTYEQPPLTDLHTLLTATNAEAFWSRSVDVSNVTVQRILRDRL